MSDFGKPNLNVLTSTVYNGRYSGGIKKPFAIKACLVVGEEVKEKTFSFLSPILSERQRKVRETYFPSTINCSFFKMSEIALVF